MDWHQTLPEPSLDSLRRSLQAETAADDDTSPHPDIRTGVTSGGTAVQTRTDLTPDRTRQLTGRIAATVNVSPEMVLPFIDFTDCLTELLHVAQPVNGRFLVAGHATPDIALAAHRANVDIREIIGASPFCGDPDTVRKEIISEYDVIYLTNPSRITGANFGLADLEMLAQAIPSGRLIIDEYYFDFYGVSSLPLLDHYPNVVVLRSFSAGYGLNASAAGFLIAAPDVVTRLSATLPPEAVSTALGKIIAATLESTIPLADRLTALHDESLRLATLLSRQGVQCRLTATDFLLLRVADPVRVGNELARQRVPIENLDGYPEMKNYLRYQLQSASSNDHLLRAFAQMPDEIYKMGTPDRRAVRLRRSGATTIASKLMGTDMVSRLSRSAMSRG